MSTGVENPAVIDLFGHDAARDEVLLVMNEPREWDGSDERLFQLQEKFNAYVSFLLDGELAESHPDMAGKKARIELRCDHMPDQQAIDFLGMVHDQLAFQEIALEVVVAESGRSWGGGCTCHAAPPDAS